MSAIPESWKIEMNNNNIEVIIPRVINTELGPLKQAVKQDDQKLFRQTEKP